MKQTSIKDLSTKDITEKLTDEQAILAKLKLSHAISPLENPMKIISTRKTVARLKTELNKRALLETKNK